MVKIIIIVSTPSSQIIILFSGILKLSIFFKYNFFEKKYKESNGIFENMSFVEIESSKLIN
jgi:hypothetical protein